MRQVLADDTVSFVPIRVIDETPDGAWVTGLPAKTTLVAIGQDYLNDGVKVRPVAQGGARP